MDLCTDYDYGGRGLGDFPLLVADDALKAGDSRKDEGMHLAQPEKVALIEFLDRLCYGRLFLFGLVTNKPLPHHYQIRELPTRILIDRQRLAHDAFSRCLVPQQIFPSGYC
jgi:hypothetical protein